MFLGHFAVAFAAKRAAPGASLVLLVLAAQLADTIWPVLVATGIEQVRIAPGTTAVTPLDFVAYPYSHSLLFLGVWGIVLGLIFRTQVGGRRPVLLILLIVLSHWLLDWISHRPDMPLVPGGARFGLGLWDSVPLTLIVEFALFATGVAIYARATRARDAAGRWGLVALVALLVMAYVSNLVTVPPSVPALYTTAIIGVIVIAALAWWVDRHRVPVATLPGS